MTEKPKRGRPPKAASEKVQLETVLSMKGKKIWREWLEGLANHLGKSSSEAVDRGLQWVARESGYPDPPDRV